MTLTKKYENAKPIGVYCISNWGGIEILDIIYGIDDKLVSCFNFGNGRKYIRSTKIRYDAKGNQYIERRGVRYYLDEFMRV